MTTLRKACALVAVVFAVTKVSQAWAQMNMGMMGSPVLVVPSLADVPEKRNSPAW